MSPLFYAVGASGIWSILVCDFLVPHANLRAKVHKIIDIDKFFSINLQNKSYFEAKRYVYVPKAATILQI